MTPRITVYHGTQAQEIIQQHVPAEPPPPTTASARVASSTVHGSPERQDVRMAGQPSLRHAADPAPAASGARSAAHQRHHFDNSSRLHAWQPTSRAGHISTGVDSRASIASRGPATHVPNGGGTRDAPSAPLWQQPEPEPVGRALQIPKPMQHSRAHVHGGGDADMRDAAGRLHVRVKSFQHPRVALTGQC